MSSTLLFTQHLKEARRDALVNHYIASHDFGAYIDNINNANDLYEYLLLDTKISDSVTTSPLSEAISSLQLAIHRAIEGHDGNLGTAAKPWFATDAFLDNWDRYNKRYSTWAGKEKLRFYAGNYIDPTLRGNKTELFKASENLLSQGRLTPALAESVLRSYALSFDELAGVNILTAIQDDSDKKTFYITAENRGKYYWRIVHLDENGFPSFGEWRDLPANIRDPINKLIYINSGRGGVFCIWESRQQEQSNDGISENKILLNKVTLLGNNNNTQIITTSPFESNIIANKVENSDFIIIYFSWEELVQESKDVFFHKLDLTAKPNDGTDYMSYSSMTSSSLEVDKYKRTGKFKNIFLSGVDEGKIIYIDDFYLIFDSSSIPINIKSGESYSFPVNGDFSISIMLHNVIMVDITYTKASGVHYTNNNGYIVIEEGNIKVPVTAPDLAQDMHDLLEDGVDALLNYSVQKALADKGVWQYSAAGIVGGDAFNGPYGQYLWELFFHLPFLIATRLQTEQRFEDAYTWYKYIFNSAGYRDDDGQLLPDDTGTPRYWNSYPLQHDTGWNSDLLPSSDPDAIAMADPMHYKLAIFLHTLDLLIARGDTRYRLLERDTLAEAKMYYMQAQQLLGPRPDIRLTNSWHNPTLSAEAGDISTPLATGETMTFAHWLRAGDTHDMGDGNFLPPYNDALLTYWDKLELRLYNLRHNLSLNGQSLNLPLYATPVDPAELHRQQSGGDGVQSGLTLANKSTTGWRYTMLAELARSAVSQLMQFGSSLQNTLERQDNEKMTLLLQTQQVLVFDQQREIGQKNLASLTANLTALQVSHSTAILHKTHYENLLNGGISVNEERGLSLRSTSMTINQISIGLAIAGGALSVLPNTFGLANGGGNYGAPLHASSHVTQVSAGILNETAGISDITASYQRRAEEWTLQRDSAEKEQAQMAAQIDSLQQQIVMAQKQITLTEMETAHAQALYELQVNRFTGQALYNWMAARLSALYYQLYDVTIPVCLQAKTALDQELGQGLTDDLFRVPVWSDLWQGLLAGEGLNVELQKLSNIWVAHSTKGLDATRTVSLATQRGEQSGSLRTVIGQVLNGQPDTTTNGVTLTLDNEGMFIAKLDLAALGLDMSYNMSVINKSRFIKSIAVTLPTLLGPYQDIEATLQLGNELVTLSHGMNDSGRFITNFEGGLFLPFEGADPTTGTLILTLFNVKIDDEPAAQYATVENLSDIIFHIHYILRDKA
ncbi:neuraminidase-like domain-containing protein [Yersinia kristensenii]|uniref:Tc toxin subunit A-related protein n=1 Tax=Yersinia kristensenii TaxID=28152 RepID=UPI0005E05524|nr:neuraminidase-like domain-containing protein [Yersinia kristensenii]CNF35999.1 insecticidal toxin complex protein [Yersinia kristensenii]